MNVYRRVWIWMMKNALTALHLHAYISQQTLDWVLFLSVNKVGNSKPDQFSKKKKQKQKLKCKLSMKLGRERGGVKNGHLENRLNYLCFKKSSRGYLYFIFKSLMPRVHGWISTGFRRNNVRDSKHCLITIPKCWKWLRYPPTFSIPTECWKWLRYPVFFNSDRVLKMTALSPVFFNSKVCGISVAQFMYP